jgi:DnaK suppressor protein
MLTPQQLDTVRRTMDLRATQLTLEIAAAREARVGSAVDEVIDLKEKADDEADAVVVDAEIDRELAELEQIRLARWRMAEERYGLCVDCGAEIALQRLLARPAASRCLACQTATELAAGAAHRG